MAANVPNEVDETIKQLKSKPGFHAYIIMNNDGIIIKYENLEYTKAVMYAYHILDLYAKSKIRIHHLLDSETSDLECIRLHTTFHEMIIAQYFKFTMVVLQVPESKHSAALDAPAAIGLEESVDDKVP